MAALVLSLAGGAAGAVFGPAGALAGRLAGAVAGNIIDRAIFGPGDRTLEGPRLADLDVMASTEGAPVARVYGRARLAGQVIWATDLEEVRTETTEPTSGGKGLGGPTTTTGTYSYFANMAVGLCEGPIGGVGRIWADGKPLDLSRLTLRVHTGDDDQDADDLIVAVEGAGNAPAYRGLAYVVFERMPLADYGNRIPQLSFEIVRPIGDLERMTRAITLIPGTTEFGYEPATTVEVFAAGQAGPENRHVATAPSDVVAALDDLQRLCPNLERIAIVVAWFGDDLRAGNCQIRPAVHRPVRTTSPASWAVDGLTRATAPVVSQADGRPAYGGTPSDQSVVHLIYEMKARGLKVTLYPFVMMDIPAGNALPDPWTGASAQPAYPWRGRITCAPAPGQPGSPDGSAAAASQVNALFAGGSWNYRRMVLHYATLAAGAGGVDAFLIGSELAALTRVRAAPGIYPAVDALVTLAADVKAIVGAGTLVTYGADWTEYGAHVVDSAASEVRFPLDRLWASPAVGAVGIDYYAPLADWRDEAGHADAALSRSPYDRTYLAGRLAAGEAYDWFYASDAARAAQTRSAITDGLGKPWMFRQKDLWSWWRESHFERVGGVERATPTAWVPQGKPIWLTELGCPAVDKGANQPSVFPDARSSAAGVPYFSTGARDDLIQRRMLEAVLGALDPDEGADLAGNPVSTVYGGRMIDASAIHLWTWDARPFPAFPAATDVWADAPNWQTGHWLTGRLGGAPLDALVGAILDDADLDLDVDTAALLEICDGYVIDRPMAARAALEPLAQAYAFGASGSGGTLTFAPRGGVAVAEIAEADLVDDGKAALSRLTRAQESELPREVSFAFTDALADYRRAAARSRRLAGAARRAVQTDLAVVTDAAAATRRADIWLQDLWAGRESVQFGVGPSHLRLAPGDVVGLTLGGRRRLIEIADVVDAEARTLTGRSIDPDVFAVPMPLRTLTPPAIPDAVGPPLVYALDLPNLATAQPAVLTRLAVAARPWPAAMTVWASASGASFAPLARLPAPAGIGATLDALPAGPTSRWDRGASFRVRMSAGALASSSDADVLAGGNAAAIQTPQGWEVVQFAQADLVADNVWRLSRLLRGQSGSEPAMAAMLPAGAAFVRLDGALLAVARGLDALERPLSLRVAASGVAHDDPAAVALTVTPSATALKPLAPVQLRAVRQVDGVHVMWIRRTRVDGDSWAAEVPLGEDVEAYRVEILSGAGATLRSLSAATPTALYAVADEIADFGAPQTSLRLRVAQLSASVGAGFAADVTLPL